MSSSLIPALSLWQPWASLIACGRKRFETRSWPAPDHLLGSRIVIHAAKRFLDPPDLEEILLEEFGCSYNFTLPRGAFVALATLESCHLTHRMQNKLQNIDPVSAEERLLGDWSYGRYAWRFTDVKALPTRILARGRQRIWYVDREIFT